MLASDDYRAACAEGARIGESTLLVKGWKFAATDMLEPKDTASHLGSTLVA